MKIRIGVDLMGSERSPQEILEVLLEVAKKNPAASFIPIATHGLYPDLQTQFTSRILENPSTLEFITCSEFIGMDDSPLLAVRRKKDSSMSLGMRLLKENKLDAFMSTGNTGALVATAMLHLPLLPKVERPALLVLLPTAQKKVAVLDVGASVSAHPKHLVAYAFLGSIYQKVMNDAQEPKIGLLNIGVEEQKGTKERIETYQELQEMFGTHFIGNIEGRSVFEGKIDVLITDGFTGNVFLKASEGVAHFVISFLQEKLSEDSRGILQPLSKQFEYSRYPGAFLCGMDKIVVKCHGNSDNIALAHGLEGTLELAKQDIITKMKYYL